MELNSKLGSICLPYPNVQLVNNENIPNTYLHDNKHLKRRSIGALKDAMYNRIRLTKPKSRNPIDNPPRMNTARPLHYPSPTSANIGNLKQLTMETPPRNQLNNPPTLFANTHKKTHAQMTSMTNAQPAIPIHVATQSPHVDMNTVPAPIQPSTQSAHLDMNTVLGLLRLYETMRHP